MLYIPIYLYRILVIFLVFIFIVLSLYSYSYIITGPTMIAVFITEVVIPLKYVVNNKNKNKMFSEFMKII